MQSREGVKHPDCLVEETLFESAGFGPDTLQQEAEETVSWVGGVTRSPGGFAGEAGVVTGCPPEGEGKEAPTIFSAAPAVICRFSQ